jgi:type IV pilus assembly protein PilV
MKIQKQQGIGLIEVMVTVLILATSLLAMAALQSRSLQHNHSAFLRSQANIIAYDIIDRIRILSPIAPGALVIPSEEDLDEMASSLPEGDADVNNCPGRVCTVTVSWAEQDAMDEETGLSTFTYTIRL